MNTPSGGMLILLVFVDDILVARADEDAEFCQQKVKAIQAQIPLLETVLAKFLGLRIQLGADFSVSLDQGHYAREILIRFKMANCGRNSPMHPKLKLTTKDKSGTDFPCIGALMCVLPTLDLTSSRVSVT